jgi:DDE_Tnp_1-associated/Transposase DDE domain
MNPPPTHASLYDLFSQIPDPRHRRGTIYPLASVLTLVATAMLCGCRSLAAIAQFGRDYNHLAPELGFSRRTRDGTAYRTPCTSELHTLLAVLSAPVFEATLTRWILAQGVTDLHERTVAIDGKTLRGTQGHQLPGVHLLAAYCRDVEAVIAQLSVSGKTNEHKTALELLKLIPLKGTLITGDAAFTQRDLCAAVIKGGGDYFLTVKDNQPTLESDIRAAFSPAFSPSGAAAEGRRRRPSREPRQGPRPGGGPPDRDHHAADGIPRLARGPAGVPAGAGATVAG